MDRDKRKKASKNAMDGTITKHKAEYRRYILTKFISWPSVMPLLHEE